MRELLLLDLAGFRCGVWKEDILSYEEQSIHWLTSKDGAVTALAMMEAHPVSLADLSYCLGLPPVRRVRRCPVLVPVDHNLLVSFVVEQEVGIVQASPSEIFPLPAYLQTPFICDCVALEEQLVPLIKIQAVQRQVSLGQYAPPAPPLHRFFQQSSFQEENAPPLEALRVFTCKRKSFVASAQYFSPDQASSPGPITTLPLLPFYVQGISLYRNQLFIILDLRRYLQLPSEQGDEEGKWLIATVEGQGFAFVVDDDQGVLSAEAGTFTLLPVLIRSGWRQQAFLYERKILSVLDVRELLASSPDEIYSQATASHVFQLDKGREFEKAYGQEQVEIFEFNLYNMIHALPDTEVEDIMAFTHCQRLTGTRGLIVGVTLYKEELLPVLDPARCFGRDSQPTLDWQLLLVCNGGLRGLVLVEKVLGKRMLTVHEQRMLPFTAPHSSVYGCYPVAGRVGLILNMLALTVYFDDEQARELFLFADELLPDEAEEQAQEDSGVSNNSLLENDYLGWKENEPETLGGSGRPSTASFVIDELEKGASALLIEEPDSLVQSVVVSMLSQNKDGAERTGESGSLKRKEDKDEPEDLLSSVVAAMFNHQENELDIDIASVHQDGDDGQEEENKQQEKRSNNFSSRTGDELESKSAPNISVPSDSLEQSIEPARQVVESTPNTLDSLPFKEERIFSEAKTLLLPETTLPSSEFSSEILPVEERNENQAQEDTSPLLIITEEQNALLQSSLATAFLQRNTTASAQEAADEESAVDPDEDIEEELGVTDEIIPLLSSGENEHDEKPERDIDRVKHADTFEKPERVGRSVFLQEENRREENDLEHEEINSTGKPPQSEQSEQVEKTERLSAGSDTWNILEDINSFPELKEFAQTVSKAQQGHSCLKISHAEFVQQVAFPSLSSPDPRKIKEQLDKVRQKERDFLFRSVAHDLAEVSQSLQPESKKSHHLRMWPFIILLLLFLGFQIWLFAFQDQDTSQGKRVKSTANIENNDLSLAVQDSQSQQNRENNVAESKREKEVVGQEGQEKIVGKEVEKGTVDQLKQEGIERKAVDTGRTDMSLKNIGDKPGRPHHEDGTYYHDEDDKNTDQQEVGEFQGREQEKKVSVDNPESLSGRLAGSRLHDEILSKGSKSPVSFPHDEVEEGGDRARGEESLIENRESSLAAQNVLLEQNREKNVAESKREKEVVGQEGQGKTIGKEVEKGTVDQLKQEGIERKAVDTGRTDMSLENVGDKPGRPHNGDGTYYHDEDDKNTDQKGVGELRESKQGKKKSANEIKTFVNDVDDVADATGVAKGKIEEVTENDNVEKKAIPLLRKIGQGTQRTTESKAPKSVEVSMEQQDVEVAGKIKDEVIRRKKKELKELKKSSGLDRHTVNKGDTLWGISEQYTGSGFNYLDVAKKNRIINPDLIYPDQQVMLPGLPEPPE